MTTILDHPLICQRYFFPRKTKTFDPCWVDCGEARLACYNHQPHPNAPTLVYFHGNGELVSDSMYEFLPAVEEMGYNLFLAEYRGYGLSSGTPALVAMLADVEPMLQAIGQPPEKLVLFGRSLGSVYALHGAAVVPGIAGLIIESGVADMLERVLLRVSPAELGVSPVALESAVASHFDHRAKLARYHGATLILHGRHDDLIDVSHGQRLFDWAKSPKVLKIFERGGHNDLLFHNLYEYFESIQRFINDLPAAGQGA